MGTTGSSQQGPHASQGDEPVDLGLLSQRTIDAVTTLCGRLPLDGCDRAELDSAMADLGAVRALCDTVDIAIARQARHLAAAGHAAPADETLARGGRRSRRDAHATAERSTVCDRLPGLEADLANGSVSTGHLDAIANATAALTDEQRERFDGHAEQLARRAAVDTPEAFARHCRHLARQVTGDDGETRLNQQRQHNRLRHWIDTNTGMYHIHCELDPETGAKVITLITAHTTTLKHRQTPTTDTDTTNGDTDTGDTTSGDDRPGEPHATSDAGTDVGQPDVTEPAADDDKPESDGADVVAPEIGPTSADAEQPSDDTDTDTSAGGGGEAVPSDRDLGDLDDLGDLGECDADGRPITPAGIAAALDAAIAARLAAIAGPNADPNQAIPANEPTAPTDGKPPGSAPTTHPPPATPPAPVPPLTYDQLAAEAFVELITGARTADRRIPEISVLIDLDTLINGLGPDSISETSTGTLLPPETIRRLACHGDVVPIVLGHLSETLDVGRAQRLATPAQRRALRAMYTTCGLPGCPVTFDACEIHHVIDWHHHGPTDLDNLIPACSRHHHLIHEGGFTLTLRPDRTIRLTRPDHTTEYDGTTTNRRNPNPNQHQQEQHQPAA